MMLPTFGIRAWLLLSVAISGCALSAHSVGQHSKAAQEPSFVPEDQLASCMTAPTRACLLAVSDEILNRMLAFASMDPNGLDLRTALRRITTWSDVVLVSAHVADAKFAMGDRDGVSQILNASRPLLTPMVDGFSRVDFCVIDGKMGNMESVASSVGELGDLMIPLVYWRIAEYHARDGNDRLMAQAVNLIEDEWLGIRGMILVGQKYAASGEPDRATNAFRDALRIAQEDEDSDARTQRIAYIASEIAKAGLMELARSVVSDIESRLRETNAPKYPVSICADLARAYARMGKKRDADRAIMRALEYANAIPDRADKASEGNAIAEAQVDIGDVQGGLRTLSQVRRITVGAPSSTIFSSWGLVYKECAIGLAHAGEYSEASDVAIQIDSRREHVDALIEIAEIAAGSQRQSDARRILREASMVAFSSQPGFQDMLQSRDETLRKVAIAQANIQDAVGALETTRKIKEPAELAIALAHTARAF